MVDGGQLDRNLRRFYDQEAPLRVGRDTDPERDDRRAEFISSLPPGAGVVEIGTGPGRDTRHLASSGLAVVGIDLAFEHARLSTASDLPVAQASALALPFSDGVFSAAWTMSTLMHLPDDRLTVAMSELVRVVRRSGVVAVGVWGGRDEELVAPFDDIEPARLFCLRSDDRLRDVLSEYGHITRFDTWLARTGDWTYQYAVLRV